MKYGFKCDSYFDNILDVAYSDFSKSIMRELNKFHYIPNEHFIFSGLDIFNDAFFKQRYFTDIIENNIRKYLVNYVLSESLKRMNLLILDKKNDKLKLKKYEENGFEFIYLTSDELIGVLYYDKFDDKSFEFCKENNITKVLFIYWYNPIELNKYERMYKDIIFDNAYIFDFVEDKIGSSERSAYELFLRSVINECMDIIGISSISKLTPSKYFEHRIYEEGILESKTNDLYLFKKSEEKGKKQNYAYKVLYDYNRDLSPNIEDESKMVLFETNIFSNYKDNKLYKIMVGKNDISRSFLTSEHLFESYSDENFDNHEIFDYTSIICGYLKSIEQLLCKIVYLYVDRINPYNNKYHKIAGTRAKFVDLTTENLEKHNVDTTMGALIDFLDYHYLETFKVKLKYVKIIIKCLKMYKNECRNGSFHLHNNYDWNAVKEVRHNTFVLYVMLLGGLNLCDSLNETYEYFQVITNDRLEQMYYLCKNNPQYRFIIQKTENSKQVYATRVLEHEMPRFNEYGLLVNFVLRFKTEDGEIIDVSNEHWPYYIAIADCKNTVY